MQYVCIVRKNPHLYIRISSNVNIPTHVQLKVCLIKEFRSCITSKSRTSFSSTTMQKKLNIHKYLISLENKKYILFCLYQDCSFVQLSFYVSSRIMCVLRIYFAAAFFIMLNQSSYDLAVSRTILQTLKINLWNRRYVKKFSNT